MRRSLMPILVIVLTACGSSSSPGPKFGNRPSTVERPDIEIRQMASPFFGSGYTAPLPLDVDITNRASVPVSVRRIRIDPTGMGEYSFYPAERLFKEVIAPGQTRTFNVTPTAYTNVARLTPTEPLSLRATIDFDSGETRFHEIVFQQIRQQ